MNNPLARLLAQAEINLGDVIRRAVDSAAAPIKAKSQELVDDALGTVTTTARNLAVKAALALLAGLLFLAGLAFALAALFRYLEGLTGPIWASLIMAGIFIVLAVLAAVAMAAWPVKPKAKINPPQTDLDAQRARLTMGEAMRSASQRPTASDPDVRPDLSSPPTTEQTLNSGLEAVVVALGEAGFTREQAGLRAGLTIAQQLRPMQVVSLALLGGFLAGARMKPPRRRKVRR